MDPTFLSPTWQPRRQSTDSEVDTLPVYKANQDPAESMTLPPCPSYEATHTLGWNESPSQPARAHVRESGTRSLPHEFEEEISLSLSEAETAIAAVEEGTGTEPILSRSHDVYRTSRRTEVMLAIFFSIAFIFIGLDLVAVSFSLHDGNELFEPPADYARPWIAQVFKGLVYLPTLAAWIVYHYEGNSVMAIYTWASAVALLYWSIYVAVDHVDNHAWVTSLNALVIIACAIHLMAMGRVGLRGWR